MSPKKTCCRTLFAVTTILGTLALAACATNPASNSNYQGKDPLESKAASPCPCCESMAKKGGNCCESMGDCPCCGKGGMSMGAGMTCNPAKH